MARILMKISTVLFLNSIILASGFGNTIHRNESSLLSSKLFPRSRRDVLADEPENRIVEPRRYQRTYYGTYSPPRVEPIEPVREELLVDEDRENPDEFMRKLFPGPLENRSAEVAGFRNKRSTAALTSNGESCTIYILFI